LDHTSHCTQRSTARRLTHATKITRITAEYHTITDVVIIIAAIATIIIKVTIRNCRENQN